jgi:hypothetical protein
MRRTKAGLLLGAVIGTALALCSGRAMAGETKGETGGKGGLGPKQSGENEGAPDTALPIVRNADRASKNQEQEKPWEIGGSFETHRMFVQSDLNGMQPVFNIFGVYATYRLTDNDTIGLTEFFSENFIADQGETGVRAEDVSARYTRSVPLPQNFLFTGTFSLTAPTSLTSQKMSLITTPGLALGLSKKLGRYVNLSSRITGSVFVTRYAEMEGGAPNPLARVTGTLAGEFVLPFYEPISFGISASTGYSWLHNPGGATQYGTTQDPIFPTQPVQQSYGGEIYARYTLPVLAGLKSDLTVAFSDGQSVGNNSWLHDGVGYAYFFYRESADMYASLSVRY